MSALDGHVASLAEDALAAEDVFRSERGLPHLAPAERDLFLFRTRFVLKAAMGPCPYATALVSAPPVRAGRRRA